MVENRKIENCTGLRTGLNIKGELETRCHKNYCLCDDEFKFNKELNERYQKAKKMNKAENGIFFDK